TTAPEGGPGFTVDWFAGPDLAGDPVRRTHTPSAEIFGLEPPVPELSDAEGWSCRAHTTLTPTVSGTHTFTLTQAGRARLIVDGRPVIDGFAERLPRGTAFFGLGSAEVAANVELTAGRPVEVTVELATERRGGAVRIGHREPEPADLLDRAVAAAVVNAAAPVTMDWADEVGAVLRVWSGGMEMGPALADVLLGRAEPAGRLPFTVPLRVEHNPTVGNFPGENGHVRYGEGLLV